jgi:3-deoxy-D-manno-octulosonic-acid transferase
MNWLYTFAIILYSRIIWIVGLWDKKANDWWAGRKEKTWQNFDFSGNKWIWFHCASLGEFDQGIPLMEAIKRKDNSIKIIVTFFSPSGMRHYQKRNAPVDFACYISIDTRLNAKEFIEKVQPHKVFLIKYEFWHNHISYCAKKGIPIYSICSIFRKNQVFFKLYGAFFRRTLKNIDRFFVQNNESKQLLESIGINNIKVVGDLRFDRVIANAAKAKTDNVLTLFKEKKPLFILGSTWPEDEKTLLPFINQLNGFKVIIAPHAISESHLHQIESKLNRSAIRYTQFQSEDASKEVLILDTIGHLMNAYSLATIAYIGGGFKGSLHNILEPIAFKVPVLFGPKHYKFPEADSFKKAGIGFEVTDLEDLKSQFDKASKSSEIESLIDLFLASQENISDLILAELDTDER